MGLVLDKGDNHAVKVEEEQDKVETELGERFLQLEGQYLWCQTPSNPDNPHLLVDIQLAEDLGGVKQMSVVNDPVYPVSTFFAPFRAKLLREYPTHFLTFHPRRGKLRIRGSQYPLMRNRKVMKPWTATSGRM